MAKPVILSVDDDHVVLRALQRDLQQQYGKSYRVLTADSGEAALEAVRELKLRGEPVALLVADQRMPDMGGVDLLERVRELSSDSKRVLLTAYADTEAAIRAINQAKIHYYLLKPWDPPEDNLYPILQDLLDDWQASFRPPFDGVRIVGHRWSPRVHQIKDFLARNLVPFRTLDIDSKEEAQQLLSAAGRDQSQLPLLVFGDGAYLVQPSNVEIAEKVGLRIHAEAPFYDLIIVGAGPAGLAAGVYGASEGLRTLLIEREAPGGQAGTSSRIENYLGFPSGLSGGELARRAVTQARKFGTEILTPQEATGVKVDRDHRVVTLSDGSELHCKALLIATGVSYRRVSIPGVDQLTGAGVYYGAAITEAMSCSERPAFVIGGGNSAGQAAMYLAKYASRVTMVVRASSLTLDMSQYLVDQIRNTENIEVRCRTQVLEAKGEANLTEVVIADIDSGECECVPAAALFIFVGAVPRTDWVAGVLERDDEGYILSGPDLLHANRLPASWVPEREPYYLETSMPGIFVAGDVRHQSVKRIASAVGEGAMAVQFIHRYLAVEV